MNALIFDGEKVMVNEQPMPAATGEALIRVSLSGICNTDLEIARGYAGFTGTLGHEFVGVVERCDPEPDLIGRRVVGEINAGCGTCDRCSDGDPRHCHTRTVLGIVGRNGAHAEYLSLPSRNLLVVPDHVPDEKIVFVEPLAAAIGITERVAINDSTNVAVIGDGKLGLLIALAMKTVAGDVTIFGRHRSKLSIAERRDVTALLSSEVRNHAGRFPVVIEASGSESGFSDAMELVSPRGTIVLKSTFHGEPRWNAAKAVVDEISIVGSRCGRFEPALQAIATGQIDPSDMISSEFRLTDGVKAMQHAAEKGVLKVLLRP